MIHLHLHTEYSLRDSTVKLEELIDKAIKLNMSSIAITDHGNLSGALEFYIACLEKDIKPIIGIEAYIANDIKVKNKDEHRFHIVLLAVNKIGYDNLLKINSISSLEGFYYNPRIDLRLLKQYSDGLLCLTACINSVIYLLGRDESDINQVIRILLNIFGDNLYLELMPNDMKEQREHNLRLLGLSGAYNIKIVGTNDVHYLNREDKGLHDVLMRIQNRKPYEVDSLFLCTTEEYEQLWQGHDYIGTVIKDRIISSAYGVADRIESYDIPISQFDYPEFRLKD